MVVATICRAPGCEELALPGCPRCEEHEAEQGKAEALRRQSAKRGAHVWSKMYQTPEWKRGRLDHLRANPLCVDCGSIGLVVPAREVDHIVPHRGDLKLFRDKKNWQGLCKTCHSRKTAREVLHAKR